MKVVYKGPLCFFAVISAKARIQCFQQILDCPIKSGNDR